MPKWKSRDAASGAVSDAPCCVSESRRAADTTRLLAASDLLEDLFDRLAAGLGHLGVRPREKGAENDAERDEAEAKQRVGERGERGHHNEVWEPVGGGGDARALGALVDRKELGGLPRVEGGVVSPQGTSRLRSRVAP